LPISDAVLLPIVLLLILLKLWSYHNFYYLAPERYQNIIRPENDVFSFGLILYELIIGKPAIEKTRSAHEIERILIQEDWKPEIPNFAIPQKKKTSFWIV
jgi:hypothetical protein